MKANIFGSLVQVFYEFFPARMSKCAYQMCYNLVLFRLEALSI